MNTIIREINNNEITETFNLILDVFMKYEAPDYGSEGVETFKRTGIEDEEYIASLKMYGAFIDTELVGVIATRNKGNHIALFFVKGEYHRRGIGRAMFQTVVDKATSEKITVNSSPYAKEIYHHLGFNDTLGEQTIGGIRFIPMVFQKSNYYKK